MKTKTAIKGKVIPVFPAGTHQALKSHIEATVIIAPELKKHLARNAGIDNGSKIKRNQTADYIPFDQVILKGQELLWSGKNSVLGFYIIFSASVGLRVSDIKELRHRDLAGLRVGDYYDTQEIKTGKLRRILITDRIAAAYADLSKVLKDRGAYKLDDPIFKSQKGSVFHTTALNRRLKTIFAGHARHISTHTLRKSYGRAMYEKLGRSEYALTLLSDLFNHSSIAITRRYLGLRQEEFDAANMSL